MNNQQARIDALLDEQFEAGARSSHDVPADVQALLAAEGYELSALDDDLFTLDFYS